MSGSVIRCLQLTRTSTSNFTPSCVPSSILRCYAVWRGLVRLYATDKDPPERQHTHQPQAKHERVFGRRNLLERRKAPHVIVMPHYEGVVTSTLVTRIK